MGVYLHPLNCLRSNDVQSWIEWMQAYAVNVLRQLSLGLFTCFHATHRLRTES